MSAPLSYFLFQGGLPERVREIDQNYHVESIAQNTGQIRDLQVEILRSQAAVVATDMRGFSALASRLDHGNATLEAIQRSTELHGDATLEAIHRSAEFLSDTLQGGLDNLSDSLAAVSATLNTIAGEILQQRDILEQIAEQLRRPYEAQVLELRSEAHRCLTRGMRNVGRDRDEDWKDALRLLHATTENPIGMQDYVAWFQLGWLRWKHENNVQSAEEAFYRAQRLSAQAGDLYHVKSLRHLAHMRYLLGDKEGAWQAIEKALAVCGDDHNTLYDAARYAAATTRYDRAGDLLSSCIDLRPTTLVTMFGEQDWTVNTFLHEVALKKLMEARRRAKSDIESWERARAAVAEAERLSQVRLRLPSRCNTDTRKVRETLDRADVFQALGLERQAREASTAAYAVARKTLLVEGSRIEKTVSDLAEELASRRRHADSQDASEIQQRDAKIKALTSPDNSRQTRGARNALGCVAGLILCVGMLYFNCVRISDLATTWHDAKVTALSVIVGLIAWLGVYWVGVPFARHREKKVAGRNHDDHEMHIVRSRTERREWEAELRRKTEEALEKKRRIYAALAILTRGSS